MRGKSGLTAYRRGKLLRALWNLARGLCSFLYKPSRARAFLSHLYDFSPLGYTSRIKVVNWEDAVKSTSDSSVHLRRCRLEYGNMSFEEIVLLCLLARERRAKVIFEFGTFNGVTALQLAINLEGALVYTLNLPPDDDVQSVTALGSYHRDQLLHPGVAGSGTAFLGQPEAARITQLYGNSTSFDYRPYYGAVDFVFVDACHNYAYVKSDTVNALRMLEQNGGTIVWHDFPNAPGVKQCLEEFSEEYQICHVDATRLAYCVVDKRPCG